MPYSDWLAEVLGGPGGVLDGVSGAKAAIRIAQRTKVEISDTTINDAKLKGKFGTSGEVLRTIARAYAEEFRQRFGELISQERGSDTDDAVEEWVVERAFRGTGARLPLQSRGDAETEELAERVADILANRLNPGQRLLSELDVLIAEFGEPIQLLHSSGLARLTDVQVDSIIANERSRLQKLRDARRDQKTEAK